MIWIGFGLCALVAALAAVVATLVGVYHAAGRSVLRGLGW